ncbi:J domain-containing protein 1 [Paraconiothyrium brasiliense]|uniref:J domain-containing protein 1 n=1 Tax=Paraconiothyrium brasiliense TaxID=300254 RepID=A0ABR3REI9_9PLEO
MLSRKPALLLSSYSSLSHQFPSPPTSCRPARAHDRRDHPRPYAQHVPPQHPHGNEPDLSWPDAVPPHRSPTPYQILRCERGHAYTKHRFYSLVKLYHPDRADTTSPVAHLPHAVRLERYRLLVAAHTILSDDAKRKAYDAWGLGWSGHHQAPAHSQASPRPWAYDERQWNHDPSQNATWEDWERWYQRESGTEAPRDLYMSNFAFVSLVFAIVTLGGIMQGTRANMFGTSVLEHRERIHKEASLELQRSKRATMSGDRNERIKTFLEHREATLAGEDAYQRLLPPAETCLPDTVRKH